MQINNQALLYFTKQQSQESTGIPPCKDCVCPSQKLSLQGGFDNPPGHYWFESTNLKDLLHPIGRLNNWAH